VKGVDLPAAVRAEGGVLLGAMRMEDIDQNTGWSAP
jgi:hypothetical protein